CRFNQLHRKNHESDNHSANSRNSCSFEVLEQQRSQNASKYIWSFSICLILEGFIVGFHPNNPKMWTTLLSITAHRVLLFYTIGKKVYIFETDVLKPF